MKTVYEFEDVKKLIAKEENVPVGDITEDRDGDYGVCGKLSRRY